MAGQPKKRAIVAELDRRAAEELGDGATAIDFAEQFIAGGGFIQDLALQIAAAIGQSVNRETLRQTINGLSPDAEQRIKDARREAAGAHVEEAVKIAKDATETPAGVQKARLQVGTLQWVAERSDPVQFGNKLDLSVTNIQQLHLAALIEVNAEVRAQEEALRAEQATVRITAPRAANEETVIPEIDDSCDAHVAE